MRRLLYVLPLAFGLSGCETVVLTAVEDARLLHEAGRNFVIENHDWRREIRRRCREMVIKQAEALEDSGDYEGAKAVLERAYPQLVTATAVKQLMEDPANFSAESSGCN